MPCVWQINRILVQRFPRPMNKKKHKKTYFHINLFIEEYSEVYIECRAKEWEKRERAACVLFDIKT